MERGQRHQFGPHVLVLPLVQCRYVRMERSQRHVFLLRIVQFRCVKMERSQRHQFGPHVYYCRLFNADVSGWNVANGTNLSSSFSHCVLFNSEVSRWNVATVTNLLPLVQCRCVRMERSHRHLFGRHALWMQSVQFRCVEMGRGQRHQFEPHV
jgi:Mycoplasma protein of unknown function, DUF285